MQGKIKKSQSHSTLLLAFIFVIIPFLSFSQKKTESKFYDKKGTLIADNSYHITKKQLKIFLKYEDPILSCYLQNLKYPAQAHEFCYGDTFILTFSIDKKKNKIYGLNGFIPGKKRKNAFRDYLYEFWRINNLCYPEECSENQLNKQNNVYYLPFIFKINDKEEPILVVENGYIFMQVKKKPLFEKYQICTFGKPDIDSIPKIPPKTRKVKRKTKKKSPAKK